MATWIPDRYRELRSLLRGERVEEDVDEELSHHLDMLALELEAAGMATHEARAEARRRLGGVDRIRQQTIEVETNTRRRLKRRDSLDGLRRESRLALRSLRRSPGFSAVTIVTLALGIAAVTSLFTILHGVVLSPLPYGEPDRLVWVGSRVPGLEPDAEWGLSVAGYFELRSRSRTLEDLGAYTSSSVNLASQAGAVRVRVAAVSASLLGVLRARPAAGRLIQEADDITGGPAVALLSHALWQREYGGDPGIVGSTVELDAVSHVVIGVMEPGLDLPDLRVDVWRPLMLDPSARPVNAHWLAAIGRMTAGTRVEQVEAELAHITGDFTERFPEAYSAGFMEQYGFSTGVEPLLDYVLGDADRTLWILFGAVALVLLVAFANVVNLLLVRATARGRELAIRSAIGADRAHLAWHFLGQNMVLTLAGGILGVAFAWGAIRLLVRIGPDSLPRLADLGVGWTAIGFAAAMSLALGLLLASLPLLRRIVDLQTLRSGTRSLSMSRGDSRFRRLLVCAQVALAVVLLASAGLMLRSYQKLALVEPGFDPADVLAVHVSLPPIRYRGYEQTHEFWRRFLIEVEALPGARAAAATQALPLRDATGCSAIFVEDDPPADADSRPPCVATLQATPGFFEVLGIPVRGRTPTWSETTHRDGGVVVTAALARRLWPGQDPIGRGIRGNGREYPFYRVIGVAEDIRAEGLDRPPLQAVFFPMLPLEGANLWIPPRSMTMVVKSNGVPPESLVSGIRAVLAGLDPAVPIADALSMETVIARSPAVARSSLNLLLLGAAGAMALLLSLVGLYGVVAYSVGRRAPEIGLRMALGARSSSVLRLVLSESARLTVVGIGAGLLASVASTRLLRSLLFDVSPTDPLILGGVALALLLLALAASLLPAWRASRVDPMMALRAD